MNSWEFRVGIEGKVLLSSSRRFIDKYLLFFAKTWTWTFFLQGQRLELVNGLKETSTCEFLQSAQIISLTISKLLGYSYIIHHHMSRFVKTINLLVQILSNYGEFCHELARSFRDVYSWVEEGLEIDQFLKSKKVERLLNQLMMIPKSKIHVLFKMEISSL